MSLFDFGMILSSLINAFVLQYTNKIKLFLFILPPLIYLVNQDVAYGCFVHNICFLLVKYFLDFEYNSRQQLTCAILYTIIAVLQLSFFKIV